MKTDAVMCMAFTRHRPSRTPLLRTRSSIVRVMFTNPRRFGTSNHNSSRRLFIFETLKSGQTFQTGRTSRTGQTFRYEIALHLSSHFLTIAFTLNWRRETLLHRSNRKRGDAGRDAREARYHG